MATAPGGLGDPTMDLTTEPRVDPELLKDLISFKLTSTPVLEVPNVEEETLSPLIAKMSEGLDMLYDNVRLELPSDGHEPTVARSDESIVGANGTAMKLHFFKREDLKDTKVPAIIYYHGGGMVYGTTLSPVHQRWCKSLAIAGLFVVLVDFRNAWTTERHNPFPAGQLDCAMALKHVHVRREELRISKIVLQGESGGANMALSVALRAKREGYLDSIDGVFANVPYISNAALWSKERKLKELPSMVECDTYMLDHGSSSVIGYYYGPGYTEDPCAWPYYASIQDLKGLPPHMLVMDELDPLRDEGIAYHRKLVEAGVESTARVNLGTLHGSAFIFRAALPHMYNTMIREIAAFANSL